jgi:hypothetical protein
VGSESARLVEYICPHCGIAILAKDDGWDGWRRCPTCARLALPPKPERPAAPASKRAPPPHASTEPVANEAGAAASDGSDAHPLVPVETLLSPAIGPARVIFRTGLILSLALLLISYLDQKPRTSAIFGGLAVIFFLLLLRLSGTSRGGDSDLK